MSSNLEPGDYNTGCAWVMGQAGLSPKSYALSLKPVYDRVRVLHRRRRAAEIARSQAAFAEDLVDGARDAIGRGAFVEMPEHQHSGQQERRGIRAHLPGDIGRAAVNGLEHGDVESQV